MGRRPRRVRIEVALAAVLSSLAVSATIVPEPVVAAETLGRYRVAAGCPEYAAWEQALHARLANAALATQTLQQLTVRVIRNPGTSVSYTGSLAALPDDPSRHFRTVQGSSCEEVLEALALIASLGVEAVPAEGDENGWALTPAEERSLAEGDDGIALPVPPLAHDLRWGASVFALFGSAAAPGLGMDWGVGASAEWHAEAWQPWVLLGAYAGRDETVVAGAAAARFERVSLHAVGCPLRLASVSMLVLRPCVDLDVGRVTGEGLDVSGAHRRASPWVSTGVELRLAWSPWTPVELGAMLGGVVPLFRPRFYFRPQVTALEVSAFGLRAGTSVSLRF